MATAPHTVHRPLPPPARPYTGPPSYPAPPRWGFPLVAWRPPRLLTAAPAPAVDRVRAQAGSAVPLLWLAGAVALVTAAAEIWRYTILLDSRFDAVPAGPLRASDALVVAGGVVSLLACALAGMTVIGWSLRAYEAAAERAGVTPPRPRWQLIAGWLVPGLNLALPGAVLAEIEHAATGGDPARRPRPSRLLLLWWAAWAGGLLLVWVTLLWGLRGSVQAQADGVLLHAAVDLAAAVVAGLTAVVVRRLTALVLPVPPGTRRMQVVRLCGPPPDLVRRSPAVRSGRG